ncbi:MAG: SDR family NAD(P)-dependent oxidoreductase, partial [Pseudoalteromonas sp.]|uniref:SDR family NAD(P)-dependent oxidoreductase n=1 Tax=Pseudoalteromonas sp. TaxID=53249 RepID=UPI001D69DF11
MTNVAIVTGGSKGIGKAIVERLEREDYTVYNLDITPSEGNYHYCDVSDVQQVRSVIADIIAQTGRVDALVSNAGRHLSANIENTDEATFDALFALNVKGAYAAIQAVLPSM